ncbi:hypothetical protein Mapa_012556 [Marchantia paleacea]|nr:hypothetical protein Mapa_012556 [Marchantia paleacea]
MDRCSLAWRVGDSPCRAAGPSGPSSCFWSLGQASQSPERGSSRTLPIPFWYIVPFPASVSMQAVGDPRILRLHVVSIFATVAYRL